MQNRLRLEDRSTPGSRKDTPQRAAAALVLALTAFEGAEHLPVVRTTRDAIDVTAYAWRVDADYAAACEAGIACVRETIDPLLAGANRRHSP